MVKHTKVVDNLLQKQNNKMKNIFLLISIVFTTTLVANINAVVSVLPQQTFLKAIGGDKVNISVMVQPGSSPHTYEPKPSQMRDISKADLYFSIDVEFENTWLTRFINQNKNMKIINLSNGIEKHYMKNHHHESEHKNEHNKHKGNDPHIWTTPNNVKIIAKTIYDTLIKIDNKNKNYYKNNYDKFLTHINNTDKQIKNILKDTPNGTKFMVFHPAWGYFARDYNLIQLPIELEGKSPKPKQIMKLIKTARKEKITAILTAPEFSTKIAKQIANELNIKVIKITPLDPNWSKNLINLANTIKNK